jgi:hypothetical protein
LLLPVSQVPGSDGKMHDLVKNGENVALKWDNRTGQPAARSDLTA